ncbi:hypothetical protein SAMN05421812_102591 [Asanoa hainanensis]|uniref:Uncharacterized protein n=1 Tax=Asanoa hainanensis TaxID=560556 RepID=A0A239IWR1_9ACTN|nr:hypothetical protein [Asanoa hainanensis]SNS97658.1 hypothetical protein SAMN05421812_102591 [Asanoa hainanensis]
MKAAFWLDEARRAAYDGALRTADFEDAWGDIAPVTFAATAWQAATATAYARWHPRVTDATCRRNTWDGTLTADVAIVAPWPTELASSRPWTRDRGWRDWPQTFGQYLVPTDHDVARAPHLRTQLLISATVPADHLPPAPHGPADEVGQAAHHAVAVIARELDDLLGPLLAQLDDQRSGPREVLT